MGLAGLTADASTEACGLAERDAMARVRPEQPTRNRGDDHMRGALSASRDCAAKRPMHRWLIALALAVIGIAGAAGPRNIAAQADADEEYVGPLVNEALETEKSGVAIPWSNPATGSSGTIQIERTFYRDPRTPCRDYRRTLERVGAPKVEIEGTGCRIGPGRWSLDEEKPGAAAATAATPRTGAPRPPEEATAAPEPAAGPAPPSCPALSAAPVPCTKPPAVVDYTMPTRTEL
jgi:surface antigen